MNPNEVGQVDKITKKKIMEISVLDLFAVIYIDDFLDY